MSIRKVSSNSIYRCLVVWFFIQWCLSQFPIVNWFRASGRPSLFVCTSGFRNPYVSRSTGHLFLTNLFPCSCCLNTTVDTSNWEKFEIQRFSIFQQQEISNFIPLTFLAISCELLSSFCSLVFFSSGCPHSPCEWTSQKRQNKFVHLSHALSIACGSSDVQAI